MIECAFDLRQKWCVTSVKSNKIQNWKSRKLKIYVILWRHFDALPMTSHQIRDQVHERYFVMEQYGVGSMSIAQGDGRSNGVGIMHTHFSVQLVTAGCIIVGDAAMPLMQCPYLPVHWCSFHQPQKDDRLSQPHLVLIQQPTGLKLRTLRSQTSYPNH